MQARLVRQRMPACPNDRFFHPETTVPLLITCPSCESKLKLPDHLAGTGKMLKCPKCQGTVSTGKPKPAKEAEEAPQEETVRAPAPPSAARSAPKKRQRDDDEDEAPRSGARSRAKDDDDDAPRKRHRDDDDEDEAPRSRAKAKHDDDDEPPKKRRRENDEDNDAPRSRAKAKDDDDEDAPKKGRRKDEVDDADDAPPAKADLGASVLFQQSKWLLRRKRHILFPTLNPYRLDLFTPDESQAVGVITEKCNRVLKILFGRFPFLSVNLMVRDSDTGPVLFYIRVPGLGFNVKSLLAVLGIKERRVEIVDADGELVGAFVMKSLSLTPSFHVYDANEEKIGDFKFKTLDMKKGLPPRMILQSMDGEQWGFVTGEGEAKAQEQMNAGKKIVVTVAVFKKFGLMITVDPGDGDRPITKKMLIAAAVAMRLFGAKTIFDNT
jgi:hypothetical protein